MSNGDDVGTVMAKVGDVVTLYRSDDFRVGGVRFVVHNESAEPIRLIVAEIAPGRPELFASGSETE